MTDHPYYELSVPTALRLICDGRASALVTWAEENGADPKHTLDVLEERTEPSDELKLALARYTGIFRYRPVAAMADEAWLYDEQARLIALLDEVQRELVRRAEQRVILRLERHTVISPFLAELIEEFA